MSDQRDGPMREGLDALASARGRIPPNGRWLDAAENPAAAATAKELRHPLVEYYLGHVRRPVAAFGGGTGAHVVCDDGSVWSFVTSRADVESWKEELPVPGTLREQQLQQEPK